MNVKPIMTLLCGQSDTVHALDHACDVARFASQPNSYWVRTSIDPEFSNYVVANCSEKPLVYTKETARSILEYPAFDKALEMGCDALGTDIDYELSSNDNMDIIIRDVYMLLGTKLNEPSTVLVVPRAIEEDDPFILPLAKAFGIKVRFISNKPGAINYEW